MRDKFKKLIGIAMASALTLGAFAGCGEKNYEGEKLDGYVSAAEVSSNGGFAVQKGEYVYFINGHEDYTASNEYGEVVKGALLRIKASDLKAGNYANVDVVVPMLFVAQNFDAGIYIYGDDVYFATPTTDKDLDGNTENTWIDFKSAKLDGSSAMKGNYFRLENNAVAYRFVEVNGVVYCMYVDGGNLYSYNTSSGDTTTLVKGASNYYFDEADAENPNVYYTMSVTYDIDSDNSSTASYNQIYSVNAAATAKGEDGECTVKDEKGNVYRTYKFSTSFMEEKNAEAKENEEDEPYDLDDYTTYPYVNLGKLVLDGTGSFAAANPKTQYNDSEAGTPDETAPYGYSYTVQSFENGGLYFKRKDNLSAKEYLYYLSNEAVAADTWKSVTGNAAVEVIAKDTTNATADAVYYTKADGTQAYLYTADNKIYRVEGETKITIEQSASSVTLWKVEGDYLYYYGTGTNGNNLSRINYTGASAQDYNLAFGNEEYFSSTVTFVDWNSAWYEPEMIDNVLLYSNAQSFGSSSYNYIWAFNMNGANGVMTAAELNKIVDEWDAADDKISEIADGDSEVERVLDYVFRTGETTEYDAIKDEEDLFDDDQKEAIKSFVEDTTASFRQKYYINQVSVMSDADAEAIQEAWAEAVKPATDEETTTEEEDGLETWQIVLIVVSSVIVVAGLAGGIVYFVLDSKKKKEKAQADKDTVNAYKKRIDTTDDKSIDVYADEETATDPETAEEVSEEETAVQAVETESVEEVVSEIETVEATQADENAEAVKAVEFTKVEEPKEE